MPCGLRGNFDAVPNGVSGNGWSGGAAAKCDSPIAFSPQCAVGFLLRAINAYQVRITLQVWFVTRAGRGFSRPQAGGPGG